MTLDPDLQRLADHADRLNGDAVRALIAQFQRLREIAESEGICPYPDFDEPIAYYLKEDKP